MNPMARMNMLSTLASTSGDSSAESKRRAALLRSAWACVYADANGTGSDLKSMSETELAEAAAKAQAWDAAKRKKHLNNVWTSSGAFQKPYREFGDMVLSQAASDTLVIAQNVKTQASKMSSKAAKTLLAAIPHSSKPNPTDATAQQVERIQSFLGQAVQPENKQLAEILLHAELNRPRVGGAVGKCQSAYCGQSSQWMVEAPPTQAQGLG